jgi:hypothetical protein
MQPKLALSLTSLGLLLLGSVLAQDGVTIQAPSVALQAKVDVILRDSPPNGWFYTPGSKLGVINKGDYVRATDQKTIQTLYGDFHWLKIEKFDHASKKPIMSGWVYAGGKDRDFPAYFEKMEGLGLKNPKDVSPPMAPERSERSQMEPSSGADK